MFFIMKSKFLLVFVICALTPLIDGLIRFTTTSSSNPTTATVIVIGAGPAGIAASTKLLELGIDVLVLEAEPRIGGRVNSVHFGNAFVDLGAEWCHGEEGNVVYDLVKDLNVLGSSDFHTKLFSSNGKEVDDEFSSELHEIFDKIYTPDGHRAMNDGVTVGEYFIMNYNSTVRDYYAYDEKKLDFALTALECFHHYVLSSEGAFSWFDTSAVNDYKDCPGDLNLHWGGHGYKTILDVLMKKFPRRDPNFAISDKIILNQEVKKISWGLRDVVITCSDDSVYTADHVIFTPSLGVLKNKHRTLFWPRLPKGKTNAIRDLGIGAVMKVMMHFPVRWWPTENFTGFSFVWNHHEKEMLSVEFPHGPSLYGRSWLLDLFGIYPVENNPNVLSVWLTGNLVPEIEKTPDETIINGALFVLNKFLGHTYTIIRPNKVLRTNWYSNPHFRGTYSFQTVASRKVKPSSNLVLAEPLYDTNRVPRVLFAGEATHPYFYSTVHGAIETGFREAKNLANYLKTKQKRD